MQHHVKPTFENVLEQNKDRIYRICRIYAVTPIEPEDLFQEVTFHIWKAFSTFENKSSIDTWIYRIALNVCMRQKDRQKKRNENTLRLSSVKFEIADSAPNKDQEEKYKALNSCINQLKPSDQSIVILSLEGLSYREISEVTGLTENHIAVKMKRARKVLLNCITNKLK